MAMLSFRQAWHRFATPAERAVLTATKRIPPATQAAIQDRAREAGYIIGKDVKRR